MKLFVERHRKIIERKDVSELDATIDKCFCVYKASETFFKTISKIIVEKCTRSILIKRAKIGEEELQKWLFFRNPNYIFVELNENILRNNPNLLSISEKLKSITSEQQYQLIQQELDEEIKKPSTWMNNDQLYDDYVYYVICNGVCKNANCIIQAINPSEVFLTYKNNIFQAFGQPIEPSQPSSNVISNTANNALGNSQYQTDFQKTFQQLRKTHALTVDWNILYRKQCKIILNASILNQHDEFSLNLIQTSPMLINQKDFVGMAPLHCVAIIGHSDIAKVLLSYKNIQIDIKNDDGVTPIKLAIENSNYDGEER